MWSVIGDECTPQNQTASDAMRTRDTAGTDVGDRLYETYGRPLEAGHWGEYIAIFPDGETVIGATPAEVMKRALATQGRGSYLFKIGPRIVYHLR